MNTPRATEEAAPADKPVALLLTDLVDSAALAARLGDAEMSALWARHDRAARALLPAWRGREIDKSDGFLLLFDEARDAVGFAVAYHRLLAAEEALLRSRHGPELSFRARAGLHVGQMRMRETPAEDVARGAKPVEVDGIGKPLAARVMSTARGGQTLITTAARDALGATEWRLVSHGFWRVKGLPVPLELHEVGDDAAPFVPPPDADKIWRVVRQGEVWVPLRQTRHTLPAERDAFVGRRGALQDMARHFDGGARLVSLLGIGGGGKTRLAQRFGWNWLGDFPGGVWFCDLSSATTLEGLLGAVAAGLDVPLGTDDPVAQLGHAIAGRGECLVVLDNFEQLSRHAEATLGRWLGRAAAARFLVTSREVLGLAGETTVVLPPMPVDEATRLFVRRAQAARSDFAPAGEELAAIEPLVRLLDGLPLAVELAAARVRTLSPRALLARMSERLRVLAGSGHRVDRQATLRATFDWSWDLLTDADRWGLAQLAVFEGGVSLDAAESVLDLDAVAHAPWVVDVLQSLVDKSFVRSLGERFELLGTVQEYAHQHLRGAGRLAGGGPQALLAAEQRHGTWYAQLADSGSAESAPTELDNLAAACRRAAERGDATVAISALEGAWSVLALRGPFSAGVALATAVLEMLPPQTPARARAEWVLGQALSLTGRRAEAQQRVEEALRRSREATGGDPRDAATACRLRVALATLLARQSQVDEALSELALAIESAARLGDAALQCAALNGRGALRFEHGQLDAAAQDWQRALELAESSGLARWQGSLLGNLANLHASHGDLASALVSFERGLAITRQLGDRKSEGNTLANLCLLHHVQGQAEQALSSGDAALALARDLGHPRLRAVVACNLGLVLAGAGDPAAACGRFDEALEQARLIGDSRLQGQVLGYRGLARARLGRIEEAGADLDEGECLLEAAADPLSLALLHCCRGEAAVLSGNADAARRCRDRAESVASAQAAGPSSELGQALASLDRALLEAC
jgi:predicted ATPase/class 3 adenylate cyclase/predicted negative regulator of RcsB-dependent stress response